MVRSPTWQSEFLARPLSERQQIALQLRRDSTEAMAHKPMAIMDVADDAVAACFGEFQVDAIIHGHTHRPAIHQYQSGLTRYVLGDWNPGPSFLSWAPAEGFKLVDARVKGD
jgi:UDP-2,3-diacylglucosamine hydrolase